MIDNSTTTGGGEWRDCRPQSPQGGCDPSPALDERRCRDKGLKAQLEYAEEHAAKLDEATTDYDAARSAYGDARRNAAPKVQDLTGHAARLLDKLRCLIDEDCVISALDAAAEEVERYLECCDPQGCPEFDGAFDTEPPERYAKLEARIAKYSHTVADAEEAFAELAGEPAALVARVAAIEESIKAVEAAIGGQDDQVNLTKLYAEVAIAKWRLTRVWGGYSDIAAYLNCLCSALTTWSEGVDAIATLEGAKAVRDCQRASAQAWCDRIEADPVTEVMAVFDRLGSCAPPGDDAPEEPHPEPDHDCGCGKEGHGVTSE